MRIIIVFFTLILSYLSVQSQVLTKEDSLQANLDSRDANTFISGYGQVKATYDFNEKISTANLTRGVLFVGHRFNSKISFFSELELEDAKVEGGDEGGEIAFEQFYLRFKICRDAYLSAGLFTPRLGIMNENHLPTTFNGNDRPYVETLVIPATWREIGISIYGIIPNINGLHYSFGITNGLNAAGFENGTGIRGGRFEGRDASASNIALTGSLLYYSGDFRYQLSGYYGGSAGIKKKDADSLGLDNGPLGTPVSLAEANIQYSGRLFSFRTLFALVNIPDAERINNAYGNNTPEFMYGGYAEAGINLLYLFNKETNKTLTFFARYEMMDLNKTVPENGISSGVNKKDYFITGLTFLPIHGIALKADYVFRKTGDPDPTDQMNVPGESIFSSTAGFFNLGFGYSF